MKIVLKICAIRCSGACFSPLSGKNYWFKSTLREGYLLASDLNVKFQNRADLKNTLKNGYFLNQHYLTKSFRLKNRA